MMEELNNRRAKKYKEHCIRIFVNYRKEEEEFLSISPILVLKYLRESIEIH